MLYEVITIKKMPSYLESSKRWKALELSLIGKADVSYFFSDVEKEFLETYDNNSKIDVVPLYIYESFENRITSYNVCYTKLLRTAAKHFIS